VQAKIPEHKQDHDNHADNVENIIHLPAPSCAICHQHAVFVVLPMIEIAPNVTYHPEDIPHSYCTGIDRVGCFRLNNGVRKWSECNCGIGQASKSVSSGTEQALIGLAADFLNPQDACFGLQKDSRPESNGLSKGDFRDRRIFDRGR